MSSAPAHLPTMAYVRIVADPYGPRDPRLAALLAAIDAQLPAPIAYVQGVFMAKGPLPDRHATLDGWLHPTGKLRVRGEILSNGRTGDDLVMFTVLNLTDRHATPCVPISEVTLQLGVNVLAPHALAALVERLGDAARAHHAQGHHGADRAAVAAAMMEAKTRTGRVPGLRAQDGAGRALHAVPAWIGYFNEASARALGVSAGAARFGETWRSAGGAGWLYRLTPEPLDLRDAAHRARLQGVMETAA